MNARLIGGPKDGTILDLEFIVCKVCIPVATETGYTHVVYLRDETAPTHFNSPLVYRHSPDSKI